MTSIECAKLWGDWFNMMFGASRGEYMVAHNAATGVILRCLMT